MRLLVWHPHWTDTPPPWKEWCETHSIEWVGFAHLQEAFEWVQIPGQAETLGAAWIHREGVDGREASGLQWIQYVRSPVVRASFPILLTTSFWKPEACERYQQEFGWIQAYWCGRIEFLSEGSPPWVDQWSVLLEKRPESVIRQGDWDVLRQYLTLREKEVRQLHQENKKWRLEAMRQQEAWAQLKQQQAEEQWEQQRRQEKIRQEFYAIRAREKELENRLELKKKESQGLLEIREEQILELKRKIDTLEFQLDFLQHQYHKERQQGEILRTKLQEASRVVQEAEGVLGRALWQESQQPPVESRSELTRTVLTPSVSPSGQPAPRGEVLLESDSVSAGQNPLETGAAASPTLLEAEGESQTSGFFRS